MNFTALFIPNLSVVAFDNTPNVPAEMKSWHYKQCSSAQKLLSDIKWLESTFGQQARQLASLSDASFEAAMTLTMTSAHEWSHFQFKSKPIV